MQFNIKKSQTYDKNSSQSELRLPLLQVVSSNKYFSVGVQSPTEINAPRGCAVILKRRCQLALTRITHQVSRAFDLNQSRFVLLVGLVSGRIGDMCRRIMSCVTQCACCDKNDDGIWEFYLQFTEIWFWILPGGHKLKMLQI
jgi:hypothetical protein